MTFRWPWKKRGHLQNLFVASVRGGVRVPLSEFKRAARDAAVEEGRARMAEEDSG